MKLESLSNDFDATIENVRKLQREIRRLADFEQVECFGIDINAFKNSCELKLKGISGNMESHIRE